MSGKRLTLAQGIRFSCQSCADCCREFPVLLAPREVTRYRERDWSDTLEHPPAQVFDEIDRAGFKGHFLKRKPDGSCIFLDPQGLCRIHAVHGEADKPFACRLFPFMFVASPDDAPPTVGARFACSAVASHHGDTLLDARRDLEHLLDELSSIQPLPARPGPLPCHTHHYPRPHLEHLLDLLLKLLSHPNRSLPDRLLAVTHFLALFAASKFPTITDAQRSLMQTFADGVDQQVQRNLLKPRLTKPPAPERILFRQLLAFTARRDPGWLLTANLLRRATRRLGNLLAGLTFLTGNGRIRPVGRDTTVHIRDVRLHAPPAHLSSPEADGALTRYLIAHLSARTLLEPDFQVPHLLPALGLLLRQVPIILLLARAACLARQGDSLSQDDFASALRTADWNFGRIPWTRGPLGRLRASWLADVEAHFAHLPWCSLRPGDELRLS